jgi:ABC-type transporter MlaC component
MNCSSACLTASSSEAESVFWRPVVPLLRSILFALAVAIFLQAAPRDVFAQSQGQSAENSPQAVVTEFYARYLKELADNKDPLKDDRSFISAHVSSALVKEIEKKIHSPDGMEADYFIQAQDYLDEWLNNISAESPRTSGTNITITVKLGAEKAKPYRLAVTLVNEQGSWKIRKVQRL